MTPSFLTRNSESSKTFGPSSSTCSRETRVSGEVRGHRIQLAHHAHAGAGGRDDGVVTAEDLDEAPHQRDGLALVAGVEVHLAAARLREGKVHLHPETFEDLDGRPARLGEERIVEAGYKERHAHRSVPPPSYLRAPMIDHSRSSRPGRRGRSSPVAIAAAGHRHLRRLSRRPDLLRDQEREHVGLERDPDRHHDRKPDGPLQDQAQQVALLALQARGARADGEVLRADHLPQDAAGGVGAHRQVRADPDLLGRDLLQVGEQRVGGGVRARKRHPEPPDERGEEREQDARRGERQARV